MQVLLIYYKVEEQYSGLLKLYAGLTNVLVYLKDLKVLNIGSSRL